MDEIPINTRFSRTIEIGWHIISAIILIGTILTGTAIGYGYIAVMQVKLDRTILDQRDDRDIHRQFATEVRVMLDRIANQIAGLREDVAKKH